jgi:hypothetical protein
MIKEEKELNLYEVAISVGVGDEAQILKEYYAAPDFPYVYKEVEKEKVSERTGVSELISISKVVPISKIL